MAKAKKKLTPKQREKQREYQREWYAKTHGKKLLSSKNAPATNNGKSSPENQNDLIQSYARVIKHTEDAMLRGRLTKVFIDLVEQNA